MHDFAGFFKRINDFGLWSASSFFVELGALISGILFLRNRKRFENVNFTFAIAQGEFLEKDGTPVKQFVVHIRNLSATDILIGHVLVKVSDRSAFSDYANGDSSTNQYELRFLSKEHGWDNGYAIIKTNFQVTTWLPANGALTVQQIKDKLQGDTTTTPQAYLRCEVIALTAKPKLYKLQIPITNIQERPDGKDYGRSITLLKAAETTTS